MCRRDFMAGAAAPGLLLAVGVADADIVAERSAAMRLLGQIHEIDVALPDWSTPPSTRPTR